MADTIYKTEDGREFDSQWQAQNHADDLAKEKAEREKISAINLNRYYSMGGHNTNGMNLKAQGKYTEAIAAFDAALAGGHDNAGWHTIPYAGRGEAYCRLEQYDKAIKDLDYSLYCNHFYNRLNTDSLKAVLNMLGVSYKHTGNNEKAIESFKRAADYGYDVALRNLADMGIQYTPRKPDSRFEYEYSKQKYEGDKISSSSSYSSGGKLNFLLSIILGLAFGIGLMFMFSGIIKIIKPDLTLGGLYLLITLAIGFYIPFKALRNKRLISIILLLALSVTGYYFAYRDTKGLPLSPFISAATQTVTVTSDALNMRAEPSGNAEVLQTLQNGTVLTVTGEAQNGWLPVTHNGASGWVSSQYVE